MSSGPIIDLMKQQVRSNGLGWGALAIGRLALSMMQWKMLGSCLRASGLNLGTGCHLSGIRHLHFGKDVRARSSLWLEAVTSYRGQDFHPRITIGDRVRFSHAVHIAAIGTIQVGNDVLFGSHVFVSDHNHGAYAGPVHSNPDEPPVHRSLHSMGPVVIEDNVWVGDNVNIVGPAHIGFGAVIGSNSVVRGDVPPRAMVGGVPARTIKTFDGTSMKWTSRDAS
jgi:acetyltransferase-like isoleucine patch superfamily enzyme